MKRNKRLILSMAIASALGMVSGVAYADRPATTGGTNNTSTTSAGGNTIGTGCRANSSPMVSDCGTDRESEIVGGSSTTVTFTTTEDPINSGPTAYGIQLLSHDAATHTWTYKVTQRGRALSHWVLGAANCSGATISISGVGTFASPDPTTNTTGIKWDTSSGVGDLFSFTLDKEYLTTNTTVVVKTSTIFKKGLISAPDCNASVTTSSTNTTGSTSTTNSTGSTATTNSTGSTATTNSTGSTATTNSTGSTATTNSTGSTSNTGTSNGNSGNSGGTSNAGNGNSGNSGGTSNAGNGNSGNSGSTSNAGNGNSGNSGSTSNAGNGNSGNSTTNSTGSTATTNSTGSTSTTSSNSTGSTSTSTATSGTTVSMSTDNPPVSEYIIALTNYVGNSWTYNVAWSKGKTLSHWDLSLGSCLGHVTNAGGGSVLPGGDPSNAYPEPGANTSVKGSPLIKWDTEGGTFTITLDGNYPTASIPVLAKTATVYNTGMVAGPDCSTSATSSSGSSTTTSSGNGSTTSSGGGSTTSSGSGSTGSTSGTGASNGNSGNSGNTSNASNGNSGNSGGTSNASNGNSGNSGGTSNASNGNSGNSGGTSNASNGNSGNSGGTSNASNGNSGNSGSTSNAGNSGSTSNASNGNSGNSGSTGNTSNGNSGNSGSTDNTSNGNSGNSGNTGSTSNVNSANDSANGRGHNPITICHNRAHKPVIITIDDGGIGGSFKDKLAGHGLTETDTVPVNPPAVPGEDHIGDFVITDLASSDLCVAIEDVEETCTTRENQSLTVADSSSSSDIVDPRGSQNSVNDSANGHGHQPVAICHNVPHNPHVIVIDDSALQAHLKHLGGTDFIVATDADRSKCGNGMVYSCKATNNGNSGGNSSNGNSGGNSGNGNNGGNSGNGNSGGNSDNGNNGGNSDHGNNGGNTNNGNSGGNSDSGNSGGSSDHGNSGGNTNNGNSGGNSDSGNSGGNTNNGNSGGNSDHGNSGGNSDHGNNGGNSGNGNSGGNSDHGNNGGNTNNGNSGGNSGNGNNGGNSDNGNNGNGHTPVTICHNRVHNPVIITIDDSALEGHGLTIKDTAPVSPPRVPGDGHSGDFVITDQASRELCTAILNIDETCTERENQSITVADDNTSSVDFVDPTGSGNSANDSANGRGHQPVAVCHNVPHNPHIIVIDDSALQAHLKHLGGTDFVVATDADRAKCGDGRVYSCGTPKTPSPWAASFKGGFYNADTSVCSYLPKAVQDKNGNNMKGWTMPQWIPVNAWLETDNAKGDKTGGLKVKVSSLENVKFCPAGTMTTGSCTPEEATSEQVFTSDANGRVEFIVMAWWPGVPKDALANVANGKVENLYSVTVKGGETGEAVLKGSLSKDILWTSAMMNNGCTLTLSPGANDHRNTREGE